MYEANGKLYTDLNLNIEGKSVVALVSSADRLLPTREEMKKKIDELNFVYEKLSDEDIERLNQQIRKENERDKMELYADDVSAPTETSKKSEAGFVYIIRENFKGTYKIGRTRNVKQRFTQFGVKLPFEWSYIKVFKVNDMYGLEDKLHEMFRDRVVNGEWFDLTDVDLDYLKQIDKHSGFKEFIFEEYFYE